MEIRLEGGVRFESEDRGAALVAELSYEEGMTPGEVLARRMG